MKRAQRHVRARASDGRADAARAADDPAVDLPQAGDQLCAVTMGEGLAELGRTSCGHLGDEVLLFRTELAETDSRLPRVQAGQADLVGPVNYICTVLAGLHELGNHQHAVPAGRGQQHHRAPVTHRTGAARRTICCSRWPSRPVSLRTRTGPATAPPASRIEHQRTSNRHDHQPGEPMCSEHQREGCKSCASANCRAIMGRYGHRAKKPASHPAGGDAP